MHTLLHFDVYYPALNCQQGEKGRLYTLKKWHWGMDLAAGHSRPSPCLSPSTHPYSAVLLFCPGLFLSKSTTAGRIFLSPSPLSWIDNKTIRRKRNGNQNICQNTRQSPFLWQQMEKLPCLLWPANECIPSLHLGSIHSQAIINMWALLCSHNSLNSCGKRSPQDLEPGCRDLLPVTRKSFREVGHWCCAIKPGSQTVLQLRCPMGLKSGLCARPVKFFYTPRKAFLHGPSFVHTDMSCWYKKGCSFKLGELYSRYWLPCV